MNQDNSSGEDIASQQSRDLTQLKKQIQLSNLQLLQLAYNDGTYVIKTEKFINHIHELNSKGLQCVINDQHRQAVIYFNQCQKILEYAASCGKAIDRTQIVVTLHNQACVNQKLWDLQKSANYLQAIIYNMNFYFQKPTNQNKQHNISIQMQLQQLCSQIHKKQMNALYYLQFCAVNSQIRKHTISLNSAKNAINIMKQVCQQSFQISQKIIYDDLHQINSAKENSNILKQLKNMKEELVVEDFQKYFQIIRQLMMERGRNLSDVQDQYKNIRTFSIGKLMQLIPITIQQMQCKLTSKEWVKHQNVVTLALYLGVCYFTVGTQLRFISSQNIEEGNQVYKLSQDFLISQVYHVYAIMIVLKYVPVKSIFLNHLLTSFSSHYEIDLDKFINNAQPQIKNSIRNQLKQQPGLMSYANSQQLHLAASMLPQQSSIKAQIHRIYIQPSAPVKNQQPPQQQQKPKSISNFQPGISHHDSGLVKKKLSRNKSPKTQKKLLNKIKKTQNSSRSRSRRQNLKHQTFINIPRRLENSSKHENSLKNKSSGKMKSDFSPNKTKKSSQKFCIYTTKIKKDMEQANVNSVEKTSQKKSKSKQKTIPKLSKNKTTKQMKINQDVKKKSQSKQKITGRNVIGKLSKKSPSPKQKNQKQSNSKSKCNPVKQKMKMKMKKVFSKIADKQA